MQASRQNQNLYQDAEENILKETRETKAGQLFHGLIVSVLGDDGPKCVLNASDLDETAVLRMTVAGMTAFGMGEGTDHLNKLHGPLPIHEHPNLSYLAYYFRLSGKDSRDQRIQRFGRDATIFLIFDNRLRSEIFEIYEHIERAFQKALSLHLTTQDLIENNILLEIINKIKEEINNRQAKTKKPTRPQPMKTKKTRKTRPPVTTKIDEQLEKDIQEIIEIQNYLNEKLSQTREVPIVKNSKVEPNISLSDKPEIEVLEKRLFAWLDKHEKDLNLVIIRNNIDADVLVKLGNWYFWYGLLYDDPTGFQKAIESYLRASQFKKDPEIWLAIGSSYIRLGNEDEGKSWIKEGFKKTAEQQKLIPIDRDKLFGKNSPKTHR